MNNYVLGLELLVIGMGTVFLSLYLLSVFLYFSGKLFGPDSKAENKNKVKNNKADIVKKNRKEEVEEEMEAEKLSSKKVAAVTAAVYQKLNDRKNYRIISIQKRKKNWKR